VAQHVGPRADVLHVDRHFDLLDKTFGFRSIRLP